MCTDVEKTNCKMYMRSDYTIECNGTHDMYRVLAGIVFAGAALGSPLILGSVLYRNRKHFLAQSPDSQYYDPDRMPGAFVRVTTRSFKMPRVYFCLLGKKTARVALAHCVPTCSCILSKDGVLLFVPLVELRKHRAVLAVHSRWQQHGRNTDRMRMVCAACAVCFRSWGCSSSSSRSALVQSTGRQLN